MIMTYQLTSKGIIIAKKVIELAELADLVESGAGIGSPPRKTDLPTSFPDSEINEINKVHNNTKNGRKRKKFGEVIEKISFSDEE